MRKAAVLALLLAAGTIPADDYPAPDGGAVAKVTAATAASCESVVEISAGSTVIGTKSYASASHADGSCVVHAAWSPDSKFFVFSLSSSGGHQPWNSPIVAFAVAKKRFVDIEAIDAAITDPNFTLTAPSLLEFETTKMPLEGNKPKRQKADLKYLG